MDTKQNATLSIAVTLAENEKVKNAFDGALFEIRIPIE